MIAFNEWHMIPNAIDEKTCKKIPLIHKISYSFELFDRRYQYTSGITRPRHYIVFIT